MAQLRKSGKNYSIEGNSVTLFGLQGIPSGKNWAVSIDLGGSYFLLEMDPVSVLKNILLVIEQDKADGNFDSINTVMISSRVAVLLFLEGVLSSTDFNGAKEEEVDTANFVENGKVCPAIQLNSVQLGKFNFPVLILSEQNVGGSGLATLDKDNKIV